MKTQNRKKRIPKTRKGGMFYIPIIKQETLNTEFHKILQNGIDAVKEFRKKLSSKFSI